MKQKALFVLLLLFFVASLICGKRCNGGHYVTTMNGKQATHGIIVKTIDTSSLTQCSLRLVKHRSASIANFVKGSCQLLEVGNKVARLIPEPAYTTIKRRPKDICPRENPCAEYIACERICQDPGYKCDGVANDWLLLNNRVCFGAKNNQFGSFPVPENVQISKLVLEWKHGGMTPLINVLPYTKWGGSGAANTHHGDHTLGVVVTDSTNIKIFPVTPLDRGFYQLPGFNSHSPYILFDEGTRKVEGGEDLRLWFGEDIQNLYEADNGGTVCVSVYGKFR